MATIKPSELSPNFLKGLEDKYGKVDIEKDFFSDDLSTYYKFDPSYESEGGGRKHNVIDLPSYIDLFKTLDDARGSAKKLQSNKDLRNDKAYQSQANSIIDTFNSFRTFFRKNYPDQYAMTKKQVQEISTSGAAGGYLTKYAYKKKGSPANISQYLKMGYKPVDQKALRKKSKGFEFIDLYKD